MKRRWDNKTNISGSKPKIDSPKGPNMHQPHENEDLAAAARVVIELRKLREEVIDLSKQKNAAYAERNQLVCLLSKIFESSLERHVLQEGEQDWGDWQWVVFIKLPTGQATWHLMNSELPMFDHLPRKTGAVWDGHSTEEKYKRLNAMLPMITYPLKGETI